MSFCFQNVQSKLRVARFVFLENLELSRKNDKFINALKDFLKKYKKKTFSKSILSV